MPSSHSATAGEYAGNRLTPLARLLGLRGLLGEMLDNPHSFAETLPQLIRQCVHSIQEACGENADLALASILVCQEGDYPSRHACNVAVLVEQVLKALGWRDNERLPVVAAALTMNIAMHQLQKELSQQSTALTEAQRQLIQQHPINGRDLLRELGVADAAWLECVLQHHEAPDGSGYPQQLTGDAVLFEARLIGLADRYCAMLSKNAWRRGQQADAALISALNSSAKSVDGKLGRIFTQTLGPYPPGALVKLLTGEICMVQSAGRSLETPLLIVLFDAAGRAVKPLLLRDSFQLEYSIQEVLDLQSAPGPISLTRVWGPDARLPEPAPAAASTASA
ncbi:HD-GYP domain-containing protein [Chitinilyticum aquatile]|uniref:HD-GYP domain-containing protein n=1 Tax=Chitinilyticum aquatile TaxID=362520 RepID=UPI000427AD49|nr:HD domain-containing phosphohydrolase [Chitinilyticum aquatile]